MSTVVEPHTFGEQDKGMGWCWATCSCGWSKCVYDLADSLRAARLRYAGHLHEIYEGTWE